MQHHIRLRSSKLGGRKAAYSGTVLQIFIEVSSYLTDKEQKITWCSFLRHGIYICTRLSK